MRIFITFVSLIAFIILSNCPSIAADDTDNLNRLRPNIVLIVADDLGINDLGCYGRKDHQTPSIDALAASGIRYSSAYCGQPICSASRAALLTSKYPARLHLTTYLPGRADCDVQQLLQPRIEGQLALEEVTIAETLKRYGYTTGMFGKWHLGDARYGPMQQGFDEAVIVPETSSSEKSSAIVPNRPVDKNEFAITDHATAFIRDHAADPFFCYIAHHSPHIPIPLDNEESNKYSESIHPGYAALIGKLDQSIKTVIDVVDKCNLTAETIFIVTSDNGGLHVREGIDEPVTTNRPFRAGKGFLYEGGLRVPFIVSWKGQFKENVVQGAPISLMDIFPSIIELTGGDVAKTTGPLDGISQTKTWLIATDDKLKKQNTIEAARTFFWHLPHYTNQGGRPSGAVRSGDWKLVADYESDTCQLYNLASDIAESHDLAASETAKVNELLAALKAWQKSVGAQQCSPNPTFSSESNKLLHRRLYERLDPSRFEVGDVDQLPAEAWKQWREQIDLAVRDRKPQLAKGDHQTILLPGSAKIHGKTLRYESEPYKNVVGFWTDASDWAEWEFEISEAANYQVDLLFGCGTGQGGSNVDIVIDDTSYPFEVFETGHFQSIAQVPIATLKLSLGTHHLAVRPKSKSKAAVMDIRRIVLLKTYP